MNVDNIVHHSGILGLCAIVEAFPYDVPPFLPDLLVELSTHLNDPQPTPVAIKKSFNEFNSPRQLAGSSHKVHGRSARCDKRSFGQSKLLCLVVINPFLINIV